MDFREAEGRFQTLNTRYGAGEITAEQFRSMLESVRVVDQAGRIWMIQEVTGQWYVFDEGQWRAASPPRQAATPPPVRGPVGPERVAAAPAASARKRGVSRWLVPGLVALGVMACVGVVGGGILLAPRLGLGEIGELSSLIPGLGDGEGGAGLLEPGATPEGGQEAGEDVGEPLPPALDLPVKEKLLADDGGRVADDAGAALEVPKGTVPEDGKAQMVVHDPPAELLEALGEAYVVETSFYAASAEGGDDGVGRATLSLPAAGPDSRILALIDGRYFAILAVEPEGGVLTLNPRLGPSESGGREMVGSLDPGGSLQYAVIHPKEGADAVRPAPGLLAPMLQGGDVRACGPAVDDAGALKSGAAFVIGCRRNEAGSVFVSYPSYQGVSKDVADQVVDAVERMIGEYAGLGFTAAKISRSSPMHVEIFKGSGDPRYQVRSGVIAIPLDQAQSLGGQGGDALYHEMAHWVQDEEYTMTWAFYWDDKVWWLETAAENMVMLVNPGYLGTNLTTYGPISLDDNTLAFQASPYDWPTDSYVHAQLVKVNMCDDTSVCPISQATFVKAINEGTYPFDDSGARSKLTANLGDYARYLLGGRPERANTGIGLSGPVSSGDGYGEYVQVAKTTRGDFTLNKNGYDPQMRTDTGGAMEAVVIDAALQKDGVYPVKIESGMPGGRLAGIPAALRISPGVPFWYQAGDEEIAYHDGGEELVLQPIHATMGLPSVRVVALGQEGGGRFQARVEMVDLSGAWLLGPQEKISSSVVCTGDGDDEDADRDAIGPILVALESVAGDYVADSTGNGLTWVEVPGRLSGEMGEKTLTYAGSALVGAENVQVQAKVSIPQAQEGSRAPLRTVGMLLPLGAAAPLALVVGRRAARKQRRVWRVLASLGVLALGALPLTGCVGFDFYGDVTGNITLDKLEYVGGEDTLVLSGEEMPETEPLWKMSGQGTYDVDLTFIVITEDDEGEEVEQVSTCTGTSVYKIEGMIAKDVVINFEE